mmetsp:Transcript_18620/g.59282  ORF Transcript_18620/g.59282 Transcript_18620/m.59282 type:complete len:220 (+) Transcript_18620:431-1090(+)
MARLASGAVAAEEVLQPVQHVFAATASSSCRRRTCCSSLSTRACSRCNACSASDGSCACTCPCACAWGIGVGAGITDWWDGCHSPARATLVAATGVAAGIVDVVVQVARCCGGHSVTGCAAACRGRPTARLSADVMALSSLTRRCSSTTVGSERARLAGRAFASSTSTARATHAGSTPAAAAAAAWLGSHSSSSSSSASSSMSDVEDVADEEAREAARR